MYNSLLAPYHDISDLSRESVFRAFTGVTANVEMVSAASLTQPVRVIVRSDQDVRIRQGNNAVAATQNSFLLKANAYLIITIVSTARTFIAAITPSGGTNGTLEITQISP